MRFISRFFGLKWAFSGKTFLIDENFTLPRGADSVRLLALFSSLSSDIQKAVESGKLTPTQGAALERLTPGAYVLHKSWGFGQIDSIDFLLHQITIHFKTKRSHSMQLQYAVESLLPIAPDHILAQKAADLEGVRTRAKDNPVAFMQRVLQSYGGRTTQDQVTQVLMPDVFPEPEFKRWWENAKKLMKRDGHFAINAKKTEQPIVLREAARVAHGRASGGLHGVAAVEGSDRGLGSDHQGYRRIHRSRGAIGADHSRRRRRGAEEREIENERGAATGDCPRRARGKGAGHGERAQRPDDPKHPARRSAQSALAARSSAGGEAAPRAGRAARSFSRRLDGALPWVGDHRHFAGRRRSRAAAAGPGQGRGIAYGAGPGDSRAFDLVAGPGLALRQARTQGDLRQSHPSPRAQRHPHGPGARAVHGKPRPQAARSFAQRP